MSAPLIENRYTKRISTQKTSVLTLCILFLMGMILGHFFAQLDAPPTESDFASLSTMRDAHSFNGWDSVYVYYGSAVTFERTLPKEFEWFSQAGQDEIVMSLLRYKEGGYFIDLAANDATLLSNTYVLETKYHWKGLCIEPNPEYWENLAFRTNCQIVGAVVGNRRMEEVHFRFDAGDHGGIVGQGFDNGPRFKSQSEVRYTVTLEEVLRKFEAPSHIDYLSLDVEGAEEFILQNFPFDKYHISIMTTERPSDSLRDLLEKQGFKKLARLSRWGEIMWAHSSVWDSLDMSILDRLDDIKKKYVEMYKDK
jgi:FkbM family methyltransferase